MTADMKSAFIIPSFGRFLGEQVFGYIPPFSWAARRQGDNLIQWLNADGIPVINLQNGTDIAIALRLEVDPIPLPVTYATEVSQLLFVPLLYLPLI